MRSPLRIEHSHRGFVRQRRWCSNLLIPSHYPQPIFPPNSPNQPARNPCDGAEMMDALVSVGGRDKLQLLSEKTDESLVPILRSWPTCFDNSQAISLGFKRDISFEQAVRDYKDSLTPALPVEEFKIQSRSQLCPKPSLWSGFDVAVG